MYVNQTFKSDADNAWAFVKARGFGTLVAIDNGMPVASPLPFEVIEATDGAYPTLRMHVAKPNPLHRIIAASPNVLLTVAGADAYVSPDWYSAPDQVPTWNYMAVHLNGTARILSSEETHAHVEGLSLAFENRLKPKKPWSTSKMTPQKLEAMLRAIVPLEVRIDRLDASFKLSQNKPEADRAEVARMLGWRGGWNESAVSEAMQQRSSDASQRKRSVG
jgi:transcriptional regulator